MTLFPTRDEPELPPDDDDLDDACDASEADDADWQANLQEEDPHDVRDAKLTLCRGLVGKGPHCFALAYDAEADSLSIGFRHLHECAYVLGWLGDCCPLELVTDPDGDPRVYVMMFAREHWPALLAFVGAAGGPAP